MLMVVLALVENAGRILLVQEAKPHVAGTWNLPGGRVEHGETLIAAMVREGREEAGVELQVQGLLFVDQVMPNRAGDAGLMRFVFRAEATSQSLKQHADEHSLAAAWFARNELARLPLRNDRVLDVSERADADSVLLPVSSVLARVDWPWPVQRAGE